jgi:hypothetical protein
MAQESSMPKVVYSAPDGGALSCATSHVFVSAGWIDRTGNGAVGTPLKEPVRSP